MTALFPPTLPANTVVGRLGIGPGPAQAIPFSLFTIATVLTSGATLASPYSILTTDTKILLNKTIGSASYLVAPLAGSMPVQTPMLIKDLKGDAFTNNIHISFTSGELCDGQASLLIENAYGWLTINPTPGGGSWYQS